MLLITLPTAAATEATRYDYVVSEDGRSVAAHNRGPAHQLPADQQETVALVPASMLSWHRVQLPAGTLSARLLSNPLSPRVRTVLEGLLEDLLLDEPARLHFALQPQAHNDEPVWVAVCDKAWLQSHLQTLQAAQHAVHRIVPEWGPRPPSKRAPTLWAIGTPDAGRFVWVDTEGVHMRPLSEQHGLGESHETIGPDNARLRAEPAIAQLAEKLLHREASVVSPAQRLLTSAATHWNLAQGELARRNPLLQRIKLLLAHLWHTPFWQPARWAVCITLLAQIIGLNVWAWQARNQLAHKRQAMNSILRSTVGTEPIAPLRQMARAVNLLQQSSGELSATDLEPMLHAWSRYQAEAAPQAVPASLGFGEGVLRLKGTAINPTHLAQLNQTLGTSHWQARLENDTLVISPRSSP